MILNVLILLSLYLLDISDLLATAWQGSAINYVKFY